MSGVAMVVVFLAVSVAGGVALSALVRAESRNRDVTNREEAERRARRDAPDDERSP